MSKTTPYIVSDDNINHNMLCQKDDKISVSSSNVANTFLRWEDFVLDGKYLSPIEVYPNTVFVGGYVAFSPDDIVDVQFFPKVVKMTFKNGTTTIAKLQEGDSYSKETGMMICIMEYIFQSKRYNNLFRKWIKHDEKREADKIKAEKRAEEEKNIKKRQEEKKARKKAARKEQRKKEAIEIQKEAFKQALDEQCNPVRWWDTGSEDPDKIGGWEITCQSNDDEEITVTSSKISDGEE